MFDHSFYSVPSKLRGKELVYVTPRNPFVMAFMLHAISSFWFRATPLKRMGGGQKRVTSDTSDGVLMRTELKYLVAGIN